MVNSSNIKLLNELICETLDRLQHVLFRLDQRSYTTTNPKGNASIGQHVRHTLEFYQCLLSATEVVNYDQRKRDVLIESSPEHAGTVLKEIQRQLSEESFEKQLSLEAEVSADADKIIRLPSSYSRELLYVLEHAIHHMALIRVLIKDQLPDFDLEDGFGVAYSTLAYRDQQANA
jgi:uncharacterized damage-inducible protein DinB